MTTPRGFLQKADPATLDDGLTQLLSTWSDKAYDDPHVQHRQMAVDVDHPKAGRITITNTPLKLSQTPGQVRMPAPTLSQHTDEILRRLGYDDAMIAQYHDEGVV